ncbi:MAG: hypothetical protein HN764_16870 [Gammaproteobacteria bacterium]|jgi:hypothetical protein|nr:hypothetical protein [Gammaproteobacteria bacterium]
MIEKRFLFELPAMIANATEGNEVACANIIWYYKKMICAGETPRDDVIEYLLSALSDLSESEQKRIAKSLGIKLQKDIASQLLESLPRMTRAVTKRLVKKLSSINGRRCANHETEIDRIEVGAEVARLLTKYKDEGSTDYQELKRLGVEPKKKAIADIAEKYHHGNATIKRAYGLFVKYDKMGCIDEKGNFIINDYNSILAENKK